MYNLVSSRNFIIQKNSPVSIDARLLDFSDRLIDALETKNIQQPGWYQREQAAKARAAKALEPTVNVRNVVSNACRFLKDLGLVNINSR